MPIQIGTKAHTFSDPTGLMSDCHRRIEAFLGVLVKAAEIGKLDEPGLSSLRRALDYFRDAAPKHTADEEDSVFPRLRQSNAPGLAEALALADALSTEHAQADRLHRQVDELGRRWLAEGSLASEDLGRFGRLVSELQRIYTSHIAAEDQRLFPIARSVLDGEAAVAIGREMAARRARR